MVDIDYLFICYDPDFERGLLFWKHRPVSYFHSYRAYNAWNNRWASKEAMTAIDSNGYHHGAITDNKGKKHRLLRGRVLLAMHLGRWPNMVDHVNRLRFDDRIVNLREVTSSINNLNRSGVKGFAMVSSGTGFYSQFRKKHLGVFKTAGEAREAYVTAREAYLKDK